MLTRREIMTTAALASGAALLSNVPKILAAETTAPPPRAAHVPIYTPNGVTLPWKNIEGVKVFHLICEEIEHEFAPGLKAHCWGYNGRTPGPTIEAVAGDSLRIYVTNHLREPTTTHWHGIRIPNGMDGVNGLTQPAIPVGQTFKYEFPVPEPGTFMYHPHLDEMTQQAMGMMGMFIVHPKDNANHHVDRDYVIMLSEWRIDPGTSRPVTTEMTDFNILTMNSKAYPGTKPLVAKVGEKIRLRFGNLSAMNHHPIHLHGFQMILTETDGGIVPGSARYPANTVLVPVGSTRAVEFIADAPGDWAMHCHMTHHVMNQMAHDLPNMLGVDTKGIDEKTNKLLPGYMTMGQSGMAEMNDMKMDSPPNSIPMSGAKGQFGFIDMGGMFTVLKVREQITGYEDPGDYTFPAGTVASHATPADLQRDGITTT